MPFVKGMKRSPLSGRGKNLPPRHQDVIDILALEGIDLLKEGAKMLRRTGKNALSDDLRIKLLAALMSFAYPKRQAIQMTSKVEQTVDIRAILAANPEAARLLESALVARLSGPAKALPAPTVDADFEDVPTLPAVALLAAPALPVEPNPGQQSDRGQRSIPELPDAGSQGSATQTERPQ